MVEVVGSIPIAPTTSRGRTLLFAPGALLPLPLPRLALGAARRKGRFRALDAKILRTPPRALGFPGHQSAPAGPEAARPMAGFRRNPSNMSYLAHVGWLPAPMPWSDHTAIHRDPPICLTFAGAQVPWGGGEEARRKAEPCEVRQVSRSGAGVYNFLLDFAGIIFPEAALESPLPGFAKLVLRGVFAEPVAGMKREKFNA